MDFRKNLISVPSCNEHNSEKKKDDEYLMFLLAIAGQSPHQRRHFRTKVLRAFNERPGAFLSIMDNLTPIEVQLPAGGSVSTAHFEVDLARFDRCMWHIACGLYHRQTGKKWLGGYRVLTDLFYELHGPNAAEVNQNMRAALQRIDSAFAGVESKGENSAIFRYKLHSITTNQHAVHLQFYEKHTVSVVLSDV